MAMNPNERLQRYLSLGTEELRTFVNQNVISGNQNEIDRVTKYYLFWNFYEGKHYKEFNDSMMAFNYTKAFIDKVNLFLLGDTGFTFKVTTYGNDVVKEDLERNVEQLFLKNWRRNKLNILAQELLQMGSICGDVWVGVNWWEEKKCAKIRVFDSRQCFPEFENGDYDKLSAFTVRQTLTKNENNYLVKITRYTKEVTEEWYQVDSRQVVGEKEKKAFTSTPHNLKVVPVVHIKNRPLSSGYFGLSDSHDILKLNKVYNELNQEIKSIIDYYATPTTVVTGASVKNLKRGLGSVWSGLPPEANVYNLGLDVDLSAVTTFVDKIKTSMHEISDVPEGVLGKIQPISGTSAAALKLTYQPLLQQANLKALTYGEGITDINDLILKFYGIYGKNDEDYKKIPADFSLDYRCEPIFAYGFPTDRMNILQEAQMELQLGLTSKKEVMNRLGKNNVPDLLVEISDEKIQDAIRDSEVQKLQAMNFQDTSQDVSKEGA